MISPLRFVSAFIAIPKNNAINPDHQSVKSRVRYLCRASARRQISSLSFALCWTVLFALFCRIAIGYFIERMIYGNITEII